MPLNVTEFKAVQLPKAYASIVVTLAGMTTDSSTGHQENDQPARRVTLQARDPPSAYTVAGMAMLKRPGSSQ